MNSLIVICLCLFPVVISEVKLYTDNHEFVTISDDGTYAEVGITNQKQLAREEGGGVQACFLPHVSLLVVIGPLVHVEVPSVGQTVTQGEVVAILFTLRGKFDVIAPLSGLITEVAKSLIGDSNLAKMNRVSAEDGWVYTMRPSNLVNEIVLLSTEEEIIFDPKLLDDHH